jgi:hypothetical protein
MLATHDVPILSAFYRLPGRQTAGGGGGGGGYSSSEGDDGTGRSAAVEVKIRFEQDTIVNLKSVM